MVSQKKIDPPWFARYQQDGFDLDLTYVTNRVIATSFPSTGVWSLYRFLYNVHAWSVSINSDNSSVDRLL